MSCGRCSYSLDGLANSTGCTKCPECGLEQCLNRARFTEFSRLDILTITIVAWLAGGCIVMTCAQLWPGSIWFTAAGVVLPSFSIAVTCARFINVPAGLSGGQKLARAVWWWFLGSVIATAIAAIFLWPAIA